MDFENNSTTFLTNTTISMTTSFNTTTSPSNNTHSLPSWSGYLFLLGSSLFYGSNYLPVKQFESGDGMFFQLVLCIGIWIVGFFLNCAVNFPKFYAYPMLSGFIWATGNNLVVPIIKTIGIGLGMIFWGSTSLIIGWAVTRFGLFGLNAESPTKEGLNYAGIVLFLISTVFYTFVKPDTNNTNRTPSTSLSVISSENLIESINQENKPLEESFFDRMSPLKKKIIGISMAVFAGILFGEAYTPIIYVKETYDGASQNMLTYLFSFYTGILMTSLFYFIVYALIKKNKPDVSNQIILPGLASGIMWGMANIFYFLSTNALENSVSYPISNSGPQIVSSLWAVFLFKEIKGLRNLLFLSGGFVIAITGAILTGASFK